MSGIINSVFNVIKDSARNSFRGRVRPLGLYYDDLLVVTPDVEKALARLPHDVKVERARRIKRAMDLSAKKKELPYDLQQSYDPLDVSTPIYFMKCILTVYLSELPYSPGQASAG